MKKNIYTSGGYIIIFHTLLFVTIAIVLLVGVMGPIISNYASARSAMYSKKSFLLANSATEEALYRLKNSKNIGASQTVTLAQGSATITLANTLTGKSINVTSNAGGYQKNTRVNLSLGTGVAFHYGIQAGLGGFTLNNSSSITGNVYSAGPVIGSGNTIRGDVISSGASGLISGITATGTAYAHTIENSTIEKDAYYITKTNTTVTGTSHPNSPDQVSVDLPIADDQILAWEDEADDGGTVTCSNGTYTISANTTLGPKKIPCNLSISGSPTITIGGPVWVTGNISITNSPIIRISSTLGSKNVPIIADNPSNPTGSGLIDINNSTEFQGSGSSNSFVFMVSQNTSAENGGSVEAIELGNSSSALIAYAAHGLISVGNNVSLKEVTAYKINLSNSANVIYDTGLASTLFSAGPGGGYDLVNWTEI